MVKRPTPGAVHLHAFAVYIVHHRAVRLECVGIELSMIKSVGELCIGHEPEESDELRLS